MISMGELAVRVNPGTGCLAWLVRPATVEESEGVGGEQPNPSHSVRATPIVVPGDERPMVLVENTVLCKEAQSLRCICAIMTQADG